MQIFLIGFMGSGKSTIGKILAAKLSVPFIDSDVWIEQQEHTSVSTIFSEKGEGYFREKEREFILGLDDAPKIIACGGGLPCFHNLLSEMKQRGKVIYLEGSVPTLVGRLMKERAHRPLLSALSEAELEKSVSGRLEARVDIYNEADWKVAVDDLSAEEIATAILRKL